MTLGEQISEKWKDIRTMDRLMDVCSTDGQYRLYSVRRDELVAELVALEKQQVAATHILGDNP